jgi:hypothetical protein
MIEFIGVEQVITIEGQRYKLSRFTIFLLVKWLHWAADKIGPLRLGNLDNYTLASLQAAYEAVENWRTFKNPLIQELYASAEGQQHIFALLLEKHHWQVDPQSLLPHVQDLDKIVSRATGIARPDPKEIDTVFFQELGLMFPDDNEETNWQEQFTSMAANIYKLPNEVGEMTLAEWRSLKGKCEAGVGVSRARVWGDLKRNKKEHLLKELLIRKILASGS